MYTCVYLQPSPAGGPFCCLYLSSNPSSVNQLNKKLRIFTYIKLNESSSFLCLAPFFWSFSVSGFIWGFWRGVFLLLFSSPPPIGSILAWNRGSASFFAVPPFTVSETELKVSFTKQKQSKNKMKWNDVNYNENCTTSQSGKLPFFTIFSADSSILLAIDSCGSL